MREIADKYIDTWNSPAGDGALMSGYAIGLLEAVEINQDILRYIEEIEGTFRPFGGRWIVHGAFPEVREGAYDGDIVIIGFPTLAAAREWYDSPGYQALIDFRVAHSRSVIVLLEGVPEGYRATDTVAVLKARLQR